MATKDEVFSSALSLSAEDRAKLAGQLLRSLDESSPDDPELVEREWTEEIRRRATEAREGRASILEAGEMIARSRDLIRKRSQQK